MPLHVRIPDDIIAVVDTLKQSGLYPQFSGRSTVHIATELIRESDTFKTAKAQAASEANPRPTGKKR